MNSVMASPLTVSASMSGGASKWEKVNMIRLNEPVHILFVWHLYVRIEIFLLQFINLQTVFHRCGAGS